MMDLRQGFQIEFPQAFIPWGITPAQLNELLGEDLQRVNDGYFCHTCRSLGGLRHQLGFHFVNYSTSGTLRLLEFFRNDGTGLENSYADFERAFQAEFGPPTRSERGACGFDTHFWEFQGVSIRHYVFDRFGPEEHMEIERIEPK